MTLEESIKNFEQEIGEFEGLEKINAVTDEDYVRIEEVKQLAEWLKELKERREKDGTDINVGGMISRQAAIDCSDCIWYKYPPQSGGQFIHATVTVSATVEETRRCELGGCDGSRKERTNGRFNQQTGSD